MKTPILLLTLLLAGAVTTYAQSGTGSNSTNTASKSTSTSSPQLIDHEGRLINTRATSGADKFVSRLSTQLHLSAAQQEKVKQLVAGYNFEAEAGKNNAQQAAQIMEGIKAILTPEQKAAYEKSTAPAKGNSLQY